MPLTSLTPDLFLPVLRPATWTRDRGLSDDGFSDTVVSVALSRSLCATLTCDGVDVSYRGLGELDLSAHRAWDIAAHNLVRLAQTPDGIRVLTRPSTPEERALEVAMPGAPARSWLAHPHPFTILDDHLSHLLGEQVAWWLPDTGSLVAVPRGDVGKRDNLVEWRHGFPAPLTRVPAPA